MSIPGTIKVIQCTEPAINRWYEEFIGMTFTVIDSSRDHYFVDEYTITPRMCIPLSIKKTDCVIVHR